MHIKLIWAQGPNREIGVKGALPWHLPGDLARFKAATSGHAVLMGRATWDSLPRKPLPGRENLVLSRSTTALPGARVFGSLMECVEYARSKHDTLWVIGGGAVYDELLLRANGALVTHVPRRVEGADAFAPSIPWSWDQRLVEEFEADGLACRVVAYTNPGLGVTQDVLWGRREPELVKKPT